MIGAGRGVTQPAAAASLYVGDLNLDVTETLLYEIFNAVGPVASCRVCRDFKTKKSLGYGYINFHSAVDAERAIDTMNFTFIRGRPCRIMWSNRDKTIRDNALGNIVIKNLDKSIDNKTLYDTFSMFGDILSCKVGMDGNNESLGYGFVHYSDPKAAEKAIERINGMVIAEKKVVVENYQAREKRVDENLKSFTNIYVKNLPLDWNKEQIEKQCAEFGEIASILVPTGEDGGLRGYCYCNYASHEDAVTAIESLNGLDIGEDSKVSAERCVSKAELKARRRQSQDVKQNVNLYIKNIDATIDDDELRTLFEIYGAITSVKVMIKNGISRGFGFVNFADEGSASKAMAEMNGKTIKDQKLYVGLAQSRDERKAMLSKKFSATTNPTPQMLPPYAQRGFAMPPPRMGMGMPPMGMGGMPFPRMPMGFPPPPMAPYGMPLRNASVMPPPPPPVAASGAGLTYDQLAGKSQSQQKQIIGEKLYNRIQQIEPSKAGKITGMLLEMDQTELLHLLEDNESLISKTKEAVAVLHSVS